MKSIFALLTKPERTSQNYFIWLLSLWYLWPWPRSPIFICLEG